MIKNRSAKRVKGFTLIEILIAIAIVGILATFAVPAYSKYIVRSKIIEAVQLTEMVRLALIEDHMEKRRFVGSVSGADSSPAGLSARNQSIGLNDIYAYQSDTVGRMWVGDTGYIGQDDTSAHILVEINNSLGVSTVATSAKLMSYILYENGQYKFTCGVTTGVHWVTTVDPEYLPASCQN